MELLITTLYHSYQLFLFKAMIPSMYNSQKQYNYLVSQIAYPSNVLKILLAKHHVDKSLKSDPIYAYMANQLFYNKS